MGPRQRIVAGGRPARLASRGPMCHLPDVLTILRVT